MIVYVSNALSMNIFLKFLEKFKSKIDVKVTNIKFSPTPVAMTHSSTGMFGLNSILQHLSDEVRTSYFSFNPWINQVEQKIATYFDSVNQDATSYSIQNDTTLNYQLSITECANRELELNTPLLSIVNQELINMNEEYFKKLLSTQDALKEAGILVKGTLKFNGDSTLDPKTQELFDYHTKKADKQQQDGDKAKKDEGKPSDSTKQPESGKTKETKTKDAKPLVEPRLDQDHRPQRRLMKLNHDIDPKKSGKRNIMITSALPQVNNEPHLGNIIGCVLSGDVQYRYCRLMGQNSIQICGTDEYGTTTEIKALQEGMKVEDICAKQWTEHNKIQEFFDIDFSQFGRTSTPVQTEITHEIFNSLHKNGCTSQQSMTQLKCLQCDRFLADRQVTGTCPKCGQEKAKGDQCDGCGNVYNATELKSPKCSVCSTEPKEQETEHIFINLPKVQSRLEEQVHDSIKGNKWSNNCVKLTEALLKIGLKERCITRDLKWGTSIPIPGFDKKVFQVWFDAPIGQISITANQTKHWRNWWQNQEVEQQQFMGKDNIQFHTVFFPCTLLGADQGWKLVDALSTTEQLNQEGIKFSKSNNTGVFGNDAIRSNIPSEVWRYYLLQNRPEKSDTEFFWSDFQLRTNTELLANLGNFCNRSLSFCAKNYENSVPSLTADEIKNLPVEFSDLFASVDEKLEVYQEKMENMSIRDGLFTVMRISEKGNQFLQQTMYWKLHKSDKKQCDKVVQLSVNLVRLLALLAEPFIPGFSGKVQNQLDLEKEYESNQALLGKVYEDKSKRVFTALTLVKSGHKLNEIWPIFKEMKDELIDAFKQKQGTKV